MALQKQTVSLNLGLGMDQKTDDKVGPDNKFSILTNWIYSKLYKLYKRYGTSNIATTCDTSATMPISGNTITTSTIFSHKDQLLLQNNGALYSYTPNGSTAWKYKNEHYPLEVTSKPSVSSELQYSDCTGSFNFALRFRVYFATDPTTPTTVYLKWTGTDITTGNVIVDDQIIDSTTDITTTFLGYPRIVNFGFNVWLLYQKGTNLKIVQINSDGTLGTPSNLKTDMRTPSGVTAADNQPGFDVEYTNKGSVGERAFIAYTHTSSGFEAIYVFAIQSDGTIDTAIPGANFFLINPASSQISGPLELKYNANDDKLYFAYQTYDLTSEDYDLKISYFTFTSSTLVNTLITVAYEQIGRAIHINFVQSSISSTINNMFLFYDCYNYSTYSNKAGINPYLYKICLNSTGVVTAQTIYATGFYLVSDGIQDLTRRTSYIFLKNSIGDQCSFYMCSIERGKAEEAPFVIAKWDTDSASDSYGMILSQNYKSQNNLYMFLPIVNDLVGNPVYTTTAGNPTLLKRTSIADVVVKLASPATSYAYLAKTTYAGGGFLGSYDGASFCEASFFINPELVQLNKIPATGERVGINVVQAGTAVLPQIVNFTIYNGAAQLAYTSAPPYYLIRFDATYDIVYKIDGVGATPLSPGIQVKISSSDTAEEVAQKTYKALLLSPFFTSGRTVTISGNIITITENSAGVRTAPVATFYTLAYGSGLGAGTYQYSAVYVYYDVNGQAIRSAPSLPVSITVGANDYVSCVIHNPLITNRLNSSVRVEWYRTQANGTIFYKISSLSEDLPLALGKTGTTFFDKKSDTSINNSPEVLYTTGGVLENYQIPSVKYLTVFKNRVVAAGLEDPTAVYYSKTSIENAPVEFAAELFFNVDNDNDPITGLAQLDDKLIIFKQKKLYFMSGDGANDLGTNSTFSNPLLIATDVGCVNHNSIVVSPIGLMFKSLKGIYLLDRSLSLSYIGKEVEDFNDYNVSKAELLPKDNQIRFLLDTTYCLVYDYLFNRWTVFQTYAGSFAAIYSERYTFVRADGLVRFENKNTFLDNNVTYTCSFSTKWLQIKNVQDYQRIYKVMFLGDLKSNHILNVKVYYDYDETNFDNYNFNSTNISGSQYDDSVYQPLIHLKRQKCDAIKFVVTVIAVGGTEQCLQLVDMSLQVGSKQGLMKVKADKRL